MKRLRAHASHSSNGQRYPEGIVSVGIVKSLGDVDLTLQLLLADIIAALGGIFLIFAGMFLSGRALIPIRRSWDKQTAWQAGERPSDAGEVRFEPDADPTRTPVARFRIT
ncbi:hypothetical protein [Paenibacillus sp. OV219]|uniref:hypothetical protein n=1 Tax=Paenibacillus sp. OV219 TaxID=1884377 RepID=UPI0008C9EBF5|nr:hypothetical protein [Paenibacillus sp. OV219]SEM92643.1 hypothetical protein SAMN05518847_1011165 [Paenibacillus sp. OV219]